MCRADRAGLSRISSIALLLGFAAIVACSGRSDLVGASGAKSAATERAARRAYDGAPPVIPHESFGIDCRQCHNLRGLEIPDVGLAPPSPHADTAGMSAISRCRQCHVFAVTGTLLVDSTFVPLRQDLRHGRRSNELAPPGIPHKIFMRENCAACHTGAAAREQIRTGHPDRVRCRQCHVPATTREEFHGRMGPGPS